MDPEPALGVGSTRFGAHRDLCAHDRPSILVTHDSTHQSPRDYSQLHDTVLRQFVEGGGLLVIDAAGGSKAFAKSAQKHLDEITEELNKRRAKELATD